MRVQVSKTMAREIAKAMKARDIKFDEVCVTTMSERGYALNVGDVWQAELNGDYDYGEGEYKVICIHWPYEYYAMPTYVSTKRLKDIHKRSNPSNLEEYMRAVVNNIQI